MVPSRYAVRVGEIDVLVVSTGCSAPTKCWDTTLSSLPRGLAGRDVLASDAFDWSLNVALVRSGDRTILIDAGWDWILI